MIRLGKEVIINFVCFLFHFHKSIKFNNSNWYEINNSNGYDHKMKNVRNKTKQNDQTKKKKKIYQHPEQIEKMNNFPSFIFFKDFVWIFFYLFCFFLVVDDNSTNTNIMIMMIMNEWRLDETTEIKKNERKERKLSIHTHGCYWYRYIVNHTKHTHTHIWWVGVF